MFADWLSSTGVAAWKPVLTALALPPSPFLLLALAGAWRIGRSRRGGWSALILACVGLWLSCCEGSSRWLQDEVLRPPPALSAQAVAELAAHARRGEPLAIVVLGGGAEARAAEYGNSSLRPPSLGRLRYGLWLSRATGIPVAVSGGRGWAIGDAQEDAEATVSARIAAQEFGQPLRWAETSSRDTHENAVNSLALLGAARVRGIVLVTHAWHMPRALREFRAAAAAAAAQAPPITITAAPIGLLRPPASRLLDWLPSSEGFEQTRLVLREAAGLLLTP